MTTYAVVPAAGAGRRMGSTESKQFLTLAGRPLLLHTLERLQCWTGFSGMVVVVPSADLDRVRGMIEGAGLLNILAVVPGGVERQDSVRLGLEALIRVASPGDEDVVFVHDAARPFPPIEQFDALQAAAVPDGALLAVPCVDTLKRGGDGGVLATVPREGLWQAQTPQAFSVGLLRHALEQAAAEGAGGTDEAALVERLGRRPQLIPGTAGNRKVTRPEDLELAAAQFAAERGTVGGGELHLGHGYDVHRLVAGRELILGGVKISHPVGLLGHSDADVLAHAVADACLGAAGQGDLGRWFPDSDPQWSGVSSLRLLREIATILGQRGFTVRRVDATLVAQRPKVAEYVPEMEAHLCTALGLPPGVITVKATTTEGLGFEGREEGISAHAVALLAGFPQRRSVCSPHS